MSSPAVASNLIISLSADKVTIDLAGLPDAGVVQWRTAFEVEGLFEKERISRSIDELMVTRPELMEAFKCVDVVLVGSPHINIPGHYAKSSKLSSVAARHLRVRAGDSLNLDQTGKNNCICYTFPTATMQMLKEYYSNITLMHFTSVIWYHISSVFPSDHTDHVVYFHLFEDNLMVLGRKGDQLHFSRTFTIRDTADILYYAVACRQLLNAEKHVLISIDGEVNVFDMPQESMFSFDDHLNLPSLHSLLAQYRPCVL